MGDPIAAVVAESPGAAADGAGRVAVDYEPLPAVTDPFAALAPGAALVFESHGSNQASELKVNADVGAYPGIGALLPFFTMTMASGPYRIPVVDFESVSVITNKAPVFPLRGAGRPEATVSLERIVDLAAAWSGTGVAASGADPGFGLTGRCRSHMVQPVAIGRVAPSPRAER